MLIATETIPCNPQQVKNDGAAKAISRRPRLVMKPNIKAGPGKPADTTAKPQVTKAAGSSDTGATESPGQFCQSKGVKGIDVLKEITIPEDRTDEENVIPATTGVLSQISIHYNEIENSENLVSHTMLNKTEVSNLQSNRAKNSQLTELKMYNCQPGEAESHQARLSQINSTHYSIIEAEVNLCQPRNAKISSNDPIKAKKSCSQLLEGETSEGMVNHSQPFAIVSEAKTSHSLFSETKTSHGPFTPAKTRHGPLPAATTSLSPLQEAGLAKCVSCAKSSVSNISINTPDITTKQTDAINSSGGMLGKTIVSEEESSISSECASLEANKDKMADVEEEAKKSKRKRTRKLRSEPLPSQDKSPDRQKMKMSDLLSWNPQRNYLPKKEKRKMAAPISSVTTEKDDEEASCHSDSLPAPQIMIGADGNVVLNTDSLTIHSVPDKTNLPEAIEEDEDNRYFNTNSYNKNKKTKFWTEDETERFFLGLSMCGTDFSLMTNLLTDRSRRELKNKFRREEKWSRHLVDQALANRKLYDSAPFVEMVAAEEAKNLAKQKKSKTKSSPKKGKAKKTSRKRKKLASECQDKDPTAVVEEVDDLMDAQATQKVSVVKKRKPVNKFVKESTNEKVLKKKESASNKELQSGATENDFRKDAIVSDEDPQLQTDLNDSVLAQNEDPQLHADLREFSENVLALALNEDPQIQTAIKDFCENMKEPQLLADAGELSESLLECNEDVQLQVDTRDISEYLSEPSQVQPSHTMMTGRTEDITSNCIPILPDVSSSQLDMSGFPCHIFDSITVNGIHVNIFNIPDPDQIDASLAPETHGS